MEGAEGMTPPMVVELKHQSLDKKIESRFSQVRNDRLGELLLGYGFRDPKVMDKLEDDQNRIIMKYGLPQREFMFENPGEYENILRNIAEKNGVTIADKSDCGDFFDKYNAEGAYFDNDKKIGVNIDKNNGEVDYIASLQTLRHELIHSLQHKYFPNMKIEEREYEAHISGWNLILLKENFEDLSDLFGDTVTGSVEHWYEEISEELGYEVDSEWDSPEYFLRNVDGVSEEAIQKYKTEHQIDVEK